MRLAYLIELVVACAVGCALTRWQLFDLRSNLSDGLGSYWSPWFDRLGSGFLTGVGTVGLIGLGVEVVRGRTPRPWGLGRWAWVVVGFWMVARPLATIVITVPVYLVRSADAADFWFKLVDQWAYLFQTGTLIDLFCLILGVAVARRAAVPGPVVTDAREWAGRAFAALGAGLSFAEAVVQMCEFR